MLYTASKPSDEAGKIQFVCVLRTSDSEETRDELRSSFQLCLVLRPDENV